MELAPLAIDTVPGGKVGNPAVVLLDGATYFFGGNRKKGVSRAVWSYRSKPKDGFAQVGWTKVASLPEKMREPKGVPMGQGHVLLMAKGKAWVYHTVTDTYAPLEVGQDFDPGHQVQVRQHDFLAIKHGAWVKRMRYVASPGRLQTTDYLVIGIYLAFLLIIGASAGRRATTTDAYFLGRRKLPWWAVGISLYATGTSAISFLAIPEKTYVTNQVYGLGTLWGPVFMLLAAFTIIPILRGIHITTTYEYLEARFNRAVRVFGAIMAVVFQVGGRMSIVLLLPALALSAVTGISVFWSILLMGLIATVYTVLGGISAVIWTDVLQVVVLLGGSLLAFVLLLQGTDGGWKGSLEVNLSHGKLTALVGGWDWAMPVFWVFILHQLMTQAAMPADQVMVQRVFATPSVRDARKSYILLGIIVLPGTILFHLLGSALYGFFHSHPQLLNPEMQHIQTFPLYIVEALPQGISGLLVAALFAACMSTLDSSMNSVSTIVIRDFYPFFGYRPTEGKALWHAKLITALIGVVGTVLALVLARFQIPSIFDLWMEILGLVGGCFGGVFILGMFTTRANWQGALVGAVASLVTTIWVKAATDVHFMLYSSVSVISCFLIGYLTSMAFPPPAKPLESLTVFTKKPV
jgi:SSS family transporter